MGGALTSYDYDAADRLQVVTLPGGPLSYTVDNAGQVVARGADTFGYNATHHLSSATVGGQQTTFTYDGDGTRTGLTGGGTTREHIADPTTSLPLLLDDGQQKYIWGADGLAYGEDRAGGLTVSHADGLGSVRALTNGLQQVVQTSRTDEFGVPLASGTQGALSQPFGFTGQQTDPATALQYLRARYYDRAAGRYLTRDPWPASLGDSQSLNRYVYSKAAELGVKIVTVVPR